MEILYVAGLAHCGSTYVSRVLNQHSEVFSAGELTDLHEQVQRDYDLCSCRAGEEASRKVCPFWTDVMDQLQTDSPLDVPATARLSLNRQREWIRAFGSWLTGREFPAFREGNRRLFHTLAEKTGCSIILDSSKSPWRLLPLSRAFPDRLRILHIVKKPANQMASKVNRGFGFYRSALLKYFRKNLLIQYLFSGRENYLRIKFEGFIRSPESLLDRLFRWMDVEYEDPFTSEPDLYHHLCGSSARLPETLPAPEPGRLRGHREKFGRFQKTILGLLRRMYDHEPSR